VIVRFEEARPYRITVERLLSFADAVIAIAITLLVLEVRVPGASDIRAAGSLLAALLRNWPAYLGYLATFLTIGVIWLNHHAVFAKIARLDRVLQWWNLLLLLVIAFMPFPNALVTEFLAGDLLGEPARTATAVYALVFALATVPWVLIWSHLASTPALLLPPFDAAYARLERRRSWAGVVAYTVGIGVAIAAPIVALLLFLAAAAFYTLTSSGSRSPGADRSA
jgi:uncharacterized membrane protein